jgi:hypothetical protein
MTKEIFVFLDSDGDIVEYYPSNSVIDDAYQYKRYREKMHGPLKLHRAVISVGEEVLDRIHETSGKSRPAPSVKV